MSCGVYERDEKWRADKSRLMSGQKYARKSVVKYRAAHTRIEVLLGKPNKCEECGRTEPPKGLGLTRLYFQWANISGNYLEDVNDWRRLCCLCHKRYDIGRKLQNKT